VDQQKKSNRYWHDSLANLEHVKVIFQYWFMIAFSAFIGIYFACLLPDDFLVSAKFDIQNHFQSVSLSYSGIADCIRVVFQYGFLDILSILALFIFSFAIFNYLIADLILIANGLKTAFSIAILIRVFSLNFNQNNFGILQIFIFFALRIAILALLLYFAFRCAAYSQQLRSFNKIGKATWQATVLFPFVLNVCSILGTIILIHTTYCVLLYLTQ